jgi:hypothetical protein
LFLDMIRRPDNARWAGRSARYWASIACIPECC